MWVYLRPGPYVCGEWDGGGLPWFLWKYPNMKFRSMDDKRYTDAVARYIHELAKVVKPYLVENGGPIIMTQIENEYGSYPRHDHQYIVWLRDTMVKEGFIGKFTTSDGPSVNMLKDSTLPGVAVGLDSGSSEADWTLTRKVNPGVPIFSGETYPGWLRHWGEGDWAPTDVTNDLKFFMENNKSFNLYLVHGGTNFGFTTGANHGGKGGYEPDVTSYDYGCPISEQGLPTKEYFKYRETLQGYLKDEKFIDVPKPIPTMTIPAIDMKPFNALLHTPHVSTDDSSGLPLKFEEIGQNQGVVLYRAHFSKIEGQTLSFDKLSDIGYVLFEGGLVGTLDRRLGQKSITLPSRPGSTGLTLDVLVEGMGRINYSGAMDSDRKGISGVKIGETEVRDWEMFRFPLDDRWLSGLKRGDFSMEAKSYGEFRINPGDPFPILRGEFQLASTADTFFDMRKYNRGVLWVNGHNLGRFWNIGPQFRLYCPASWLKVGKNVMTILDMDGKVPVRHGPPVEGFATMR